MIDPELLKILVCPENKTVVKLVQEDVISKINESITAGRLVNRSGEKIDTPIEAGLIREDGKFLYPVRDDIPVMLIDEAIPMEQLGS